MTAAIETYDVAIAGAGPAGTSVAIHLAMRGVRVLLAEQKTFPRAKLCGEFISPECLQHFKRLGVAEEILLAGGARLTETVFYSRSGNSVSVPTQWFGSDSGALGLSRAEMDQKLLERAKSVGVFVLEDAQASDLIPGKPGERVGGIRLKSANQTSDYRSHITIDATGRTRALVRRLGYQQTYLRTSKRGLQPRPRPRLIAFKAHLENARPADGVCEIYFYSGGYGGLSSIEAGLSNLCFIASAKDVRRCGSDPETVIQQTVLQNSRAAFTLAQSHVCSEWLGISLEDCGRRSLVPAQGLLTIGDAASFIDPFTGSGMLMALESGEVVAEAIATHREKLGLENSFEELARDYRARYRKRFDSRLRVSAFLRRAAYIPRLAEAAILCFGASARLRRRVARATRPSRDRKGPA